MKEGEPIRLQKIIAEQGLCSRREAERWIEEGFVQVNGKTATLGQKADPRKDQIFVRNKLIQPRTDKEIIVLAINKPKGYICSHQDPYNSQTIYQLLPKEFQKTKFHCAGRLDKDSEGLVILTNDGATANDIMHPSKKVVKRYRIQLDRPFESNLTAKLLKGIYDEGEHLSAKKIIPASVGAYREYRVEVHLEQGRKRQIRRLFARFGYTVQKLIRCQIGEFVLKQMPSGCIRRLKAKEIDLLFKN